MCVLQVEFLNISKLQIEANTFLIPLMQLLLHIVLDVEKKLILQLMSHESVL